MSELSEDKLWEELDGLYAYDEGDTEISIIDPKLREQVRTQLVAMGDDQLRLFLAVRVRDTFLSDDALEDGFGLEDVVAFADWFEQFLAGEVDKP